MKANENEVYGGLMQSEIEAAVVWLLDIQERSGGKTSPSAVCAELCARGFDAMVGSPWRSKPREDSFEAVCDWARRSGEYRLMVRGNVRFIVRRGSAAEERLTGLMRKETRRRLHRGGRR